MKDILIDYLPYYYKNIEEMIKLQESIGLEYGSLKEKIDDLFDQTYIHRATWGLVIWEKTLNLDIGNGMDNLEERREKILAKFRNEGITNIQKIKSLALIFTTGRVEVIENYDNYSFKIKFTSIVGKVPNLENFKRAVDTLKPAHLGYEIEFRYNTHKELNQHNLTHNQLKEHTHKQLYDTRIFED